MICTNCEITNKGLIGGQAFTQYTCEKCGQVTLHHNTNVPKICPICSNKYGICQYCGSSIFVEKIIKLKESKSLYEIALEVGCSESSLRKFVTEGTIGHKILEKVKSYLGVEK